MKKLLLFFSVAIIFIYGCGTKRLLEYGIDTSKMDTISQPKMNSKFSVEVTGADKNFPDTTRIIPNGRYVIVLPFCAFYKKHFICMPSKKSFEKINDNFIAVLSNEIIASKLSDNLSGNYKLRVNVEDSKFKFDYYHKGSMFIIIVASLRFKNEYISPMYYSMKVNYELLDGDKVIKTGSLSKEMMIKEEISTEVPLPSAPMYIRNPYYIPGTGMSEGHYNTANDYQQLMGGPHEETKYAMKYGFVGIINMMSDISKDICKDIKEKVK